MKVEGYACHWNRRNANGEIVTPTSFDQSLEYYSTNNLAVPINFNHNENMILGKVTTFKKTDSGLYITADLNDEVDIVKNYVKPLVKDGTLNRFSTEGIINRKDTEKISDNTYIAKIFNLRAVAIVSNPADIDASFRSVNSINDSKIVYFDAFKEKNRMLYII